MYIIFLLYFFLSFIILLITSKVSYNFKLLDIPNKRKIHNKSTAFTGGIALSIILIFSIIIFDSFNPTLSLILTMAFLISVVGLVDDIFSLNASAKLCLQIVPIFYLLINSNLTLNSMGDYNYFNLDIGSFSFPFTVLSLLFLINSFNYFDGVDGLLGVCSISVISILLFMLHKPKSFFK